MTDILNILGYGGTVAFVGIAVVFVMLALLIIIVWFASKIFARLNADAEEKKQAAAAAAAKAAAEASAKAAAENAAAEAAEAAAEAAAMEEVTDSEELIAVIAAALAAYDNSGKTLVVRKVRRVSAWNKSSRAEQVCRF